MINVEPDESIQDKIDEELAEMEADGSDSEGRSAGATPNSIISITDEETILDGETIDLTADEASTIVIESRLRLVIMLTNLKYDVNHIIPREDTYKVLRILQDEQGPLRNFDEVYAYLEAHLYKPNRVQIVVEEFLGMTNIEDDNSRSPSPDIRQVEDKTEVFQKGKGVGKKSKLKAVQDGETKEPETTETPETTDNVNASKRNLLSDEKSSAPEKKKIKLEDGVTSSSQPNPSKTKKEKNGRADPLTEDMLHGPFDFSQHRAEANNRNNRRTQNLSQELQDIVEDSSRSKKHGGILTPARLKHFTPQLIAEPPTSPSVSYSPSRDYIKPGKLLPPETRVTNSNSQPPAQARERVPSIEVVGEEIVENEVVEIPDLDQADVAAVNLLADNLVAIFPNTPREYIQMRCVDLVGKVAAIDRFTEELLMDPNPPENWEQIYKKPFIAVLEEREKAPVIGPQESSNSHEERGHPNATSTSSTSGSRDQAEVETVQEDGAGAQPPPEDPTSTAAGEPKQPEAELDPMVSWELERHGQLLSMFPDLCPDYLLNDVVRAINKPNTADQDGSAPNPNVQQLDTLFATHVERMFAMRPEERRMLPTRSQWETNRKEKEELEKWSGNMSVNDMLLLYSDDPAGYFGNPDRKPESELYKQHAVEGLKNEFRFVSLCLLAGQF